MISCEHVYVNGTLSFGISPRYTRKRSDVSYFFENMVMVFSIQFPLKAPFYGNGLAILRGLAFFAEIVPSDLIPYENIFCLYERRAAPPSHDLAIEQLRSRLGRLEIFHVSTTKRTGLDPGTRYNGARVTNAL